MSTTVKSLNTKDKLSNMSKCPVRSGENAILILRAQHNRIKYSYSQNHSYSDSSTDEDNHDDHPGYLRICVHDVWDPSSCLKSEPHQLCTRHSSAMGCRFLHWCRIQISKELCNESNCKMNHLDSVHQPAPNIEDFPDLSG